MSDAQVLEAAHVGPTRLAYTLKQASEAGAGGITKLYEALADGRLKARKRGRNVVVLHDDLMAFLASLPPYAPPGRPVAERKSGAASEAA